VFPHLAGPLRGQSYRTAIPRVQAGGRACGQTSRRPQVHAVGRTVVIGSGFYDLRIQGQSLERPQVVHSARSATARLTHHVRPRWRDDRFFADGFTPKVTLDARSRSPPLRLGQDGQNTIVCYGRMLGLTGRRDGWVRSAS
jgi:hypothetical protein